MGRMRNKLIYTIHTYGGCVFSNEKNASSGKQQLGNTAEFTDIDNLFDGIAHELNELLTSAVDS